MNSKEIMLVAEVVSNEKGVSKEVIYQALEAALATAARKTYTFDVDLRVEIDRKTGQYVTYRRWVVVDDDLPVEERLPTRQISLSAARFDDPEVQLGDIVEDLVDNIPFARIGAQTAKQVIYQKVREAERNMIADQYRNQVGHLFRGTVKKVERGNIIVDIGNNVEAFIPKEYALPKEMVRSGDQIRAILFEIRNDGRNGPQIILSRTDNALIQALFTLEVPEINQGLLEIMATARDPGVRAKIAVKTHDQRIDPIGACVGMRGSRVQSVTAELGGERVDIVLWDDNPVQYVINAMSPAEVVSIVIDEDKHSMDIAVAQEKLSQAIGREGQNVRLASELTGWVLNVMSDEDANAKTEREHQKVTQLFIDHLEIEAEIAEILAREGFTTLEEIAYVPASEMLEIEEFDEDIVEALRSNARNALLAQAILRQELGEKAPDEAFIELLDSEDLAYQLAQKGVSSVDDLAELATDELCEISGLDEKTAADLIMQARKTWFEN